MPWSIKDSLSLTFSAIALVSSLISVYFNFFRHVDDVQIFVSDFATQPDRDCAITHVAFVNRGNQPRLVTGAESVAGSDGNISSDSFGAPMNSPPSTFPFVLDKGQMKLVEFSQPLSFLISNGATAFSRRSSTTNPTLYYGLKVATIDSNAAEVSTQVIFAELRLNLADKRVESYRTNRAATHLVNNTAISFPVNRPWTGRCQ